MKKILRSPTLTKYFLKIIISSTVCSDFVKSLTHSETFQENGRFNNNGPSINILSHSSSVYLLSLSNKQHEVSFFSSCFYSFK